MSRGLDTLVRLARWRLEEARREQGARESHRDALAGAHAGRADLVDRGAGLGRRRTQCGEEQNGMQHVFPQDQGGARAPRGLLESPRTPRTARF